MVIVTMTSSHMEIKANIALMDVGKHCVNTQGRSPPADIDFKIH